jgi:serine/threonine-protein kinase
MAEVFLAQQRGLEGFDRRVAVKRILPHLADSPDFMKMFFGEAKLAAQLSHPNVVHIYEFGKVEHDYFIAMEFVDGVHAGQLFKHGEKEKLPATLVARIGADAAAGLHYAHELRSATGKLLGLVHRDVSPANIMVSFDGVVKLCDFGIAKAAAASDQLTNPGQVKGKYAYMSPEQTIAAQLDGRSDVFSLGVVMWELLTGKYIVQRGDAVAAMRSIRDGKLDPIEKHAPNVPAPLAKAITWALEPRREKRATAAELATALEAFLKSAPEIATSMQLGGWIRARFVREGTGQVPAMDPGTGAAPAQPGTHIGPGTQAGPGTVAAPGTAQASPATLAAPGTAAGGRSIHHLPPTPPIFPARRVVKLLSDTAEGTEIYSTADIDEAAETLKGARPAHGTRLSEPAHLAHANRAADEPTLHARASGVGDATEVVRNAPPAPDEEDSENHYETIQQDMRPPIPSGPIVVPTRVQGGLPLPAPVRSSESSVRPLPSPLVPDAIARAHGSGMRGAVAARRSAVLPPELLRKKRKKTLLAFGGLAALTLTSFLIALAASSGNRGAAPPPRDAAPMLESPDSAPLPLAEPPLDAAPQAASTIDAAPAAEAMAYLIVRTVPDGATIKVGDQSRVAAAQPGDPSGAATAQLVLTPGKHEITAELAGYQDERRTVVLSDGEQENLEITFTKKLGTKPERTGRLTVQTTPWSDVYLGQKSLGRSPFRGLEIPVGTHTLTFKNPSRPTATKTITIKAGKTAKLNFNL